jgi:hypothetical protein
MMAEVDMMAKVDGRRVGHEACVVQAGNGPDGTERGAGLPALIGGN